MSHLRTILFVLCAIAGITLSALGLWGGVVMAAWSALLVGCIRMPPRESTTIHIHYTGNGKIPDDPEFAERLLEAISRGAKPKQ